MSMPSSRDSDYLGATVNLGPGDAFVVERNTLKGVDDYHVTKAERVDQAALELEEIARQLRRAYGIEVTYDESSVDPF